MKNIKIISIILLLWLTLVSCWKEPEKKINNSTNNTPSTDKVENKINTNTWTNMNINKWVINNDNSVKEWDDISVHYTWTLEDWTKFDSSLDRGKTLDFKAWVGQMIPWFDAWVIWMKVWEKKKIEIEAKDAYWEYDSTKEQIVPKKDLESFESTWYKLIKWVCKKFIVL